MRIMALTVSSNVAISRADVNMENAAYCILQEELEKGIQSMKNEEIYTLEEAWEEINKI